MKKDNGFYNLYVISSTCNFPKISLASNNKISLIVRGLDNRKFRVTVCDSINGYKGDFKLERFDNFEVIKFRKEIFCSYLINSFRFIKYIIKDSNSFLVSSLATYSYKDLLLIFVLKYFLGIKFIFIFHELHESFAHNYVARIKHHCLDILACKMASLVLPISHYLTDFAKKYNENIASLPIMYDYERQYPFSQNCKKGLFSYCGTVTYIRIIRRIIDVIKCVRIEYPQVEVNLIVSGNPTQIQKLIKEYEEDDFIHFYTGVSNQKLFKLYSESYGLLIPLDEKNLQDKARFSQKIAEYISTKRPIITNSVGEIPYYFRDGENAFIMESIEKEFFVSKIKDIMKMDAQKISLIGKKGYEIGATNFDYKMVMGKIGDVICKL